MIPGQTVDVSGRGFPPTSPVQAELFSTPVLLGTSASDAAGNVRSTVTVPLDTSPGLHTLRVSAVGGTAFAEVTLSVSARPAASPSVGILTRTGSDVAGPARLALALVGAGVLLVGAAQRRRGPWMPRHRR